MKIIYIAGDGRSGSTLLDAILSNANNTISIGESYRFWRRFYEADTLCGCNNKIQECSLWNNVDKVLQNQIKNYNSTDVWQRIQFLLKFKHVKRIPEIISSPDWDNFKKIVKLFYLTIEKETNKKVIIDSSKSLGWLYLLLSMNFCEIKIIHLERDLPSVANSWKKDILLPEYYDKKVKMPKKSNYVILKSWIKIAYLASLLKNKENYFFLHYNDFINKPEKHLKRIEKFTNISLTRPFKMVFNHSIGGNPIRKTDSREISIRNTPQSLNNLTSAEKFFFKFINCMKKRIV